jgi:hypothetical protein
MSLYGTFTYGSAVYGVTDLPASAMWEVFDFCEPTDAIMMTLFGYSETVALRTFGPPSLWFDGNADLIIKSDDGAASGFYIDTLIADHFSLQVTFLPTQLPADFSSTSTNRVFFGVYNAYSKCVGVALSENQGLAIGTTGDGLLTPLTGSDELFDASSTDYYTLRIVGNAATGRANLYLTRTDLVSIIGHQLRYTFDLLDTPLGTLDRVVCEVYGTSGAPSEIALDCIRLSREVRVPNARPIAVPGDDQTIIVGSYAGLDGRASYDPEGVTPLDYFWTLLTTPENSALQLTGSGQTIADPSGYTDELQGGAGDFDDIDVGDLVYVGGSGSLVVYRGSTFLVVAEKVFPAGDTAAEWIAIRQLAWGGDYVSAERVLVQEQRSSPPGSPSVGDVFLVTATASGAWTGQEDRLATWNGSWSFTSPNADDLIFDIATRQHHRYIGGNYPAGQWEESAALPWEMPHWSGRTTSIGSLLLDAAGTYTAELVVHDGEVMSLPVEVVISAQETAVPFGYVPDEGWIWNYLPDFWSLVADKEKITSTWNGFAQAAAGLLLELWQHDYAKAILDIQRIFQRRWLAYAARSEDPDAETYPATFYTTHNVAGYSASPGTNEYSYETGITVPTTEIEKYLLVLEGTAYRIARANGTKVVTVDPLPTTDRPTSFMIKPTLVLNSLNLEYEGVAFGDSAVFQVTDSNGNVSEYEAFVYGARRQQLAFDVSSIAGPLADPDQTVLYVGTSRRDSWRLNDAVVGLPRLQQYIDRSTDTTAPYLYENLNHIVETRDVEGTDVNMLLFRDAWYTEAVRGFDGDTTAGPGYFDSASSDFEALFGAGADLTGYVLEAGGVRYRLYQVISATRVELEDEALAPDTGLSWRILALNELPEYMWAEVTYLDNKPTIEANFGRLVNFTQEDLAARSDELDYLSAVQGLWYAYWFGPRPYNIRIGAQILLGLPFAEVEGTITDINTSFDSSRARVLIQDANNSTSVRSYFYPSNLSLETNPETGSVYALGDTVAQFAPLCTGVEVEDYISDPDWFAPYVASGDFVEVWKVHTFGIFVDSSVFDLENLQLVLEYVNNIKPPYTKPWFVVSDSHVRDINVGEYLALGPVADGELYDTWAYPTPLGWYNSPYETLVTRIAAPTYDIADTWPTNRPVGPNHATWRDLGNLHLSTVVGRVPATDPGTSQRVVSLGTFAIGSRDGSGRLIHTLGVGSPISLVDADMEITGVANWPDISGAGPTTKVKDTGIVYAGSQSLKIEDAAADKGVYRDYSLVPEGHQLAVRLQLYVVSGGAVIQLVRLIDPTGEEVLAERRSAGTGSVWQEVVVHAWKYEGATLGLQLRCMTGPAGGTFYIDDVEMFEQEMGWGQWGIGSYYSGRTGGFTDGGCPDDVLTLQISAELS